MMEKDQLWTFKLIKSKRQVSFGLGKSAANLLSFWHSCLHVFDGYTLEVNAALSHI